MAELEPEAEVEREARGPSECRQAVALAASQEDSQEVVPHKRNGDRSQRDLTRETKPSEDKPYRPTLGKRLCQPFHMRMDRHFVTLSPEHQSISKPIPSMRLSQCKTLSLSLLLRWGRNTCQNRDCCKPANSENRREASRHCQAHGSDEAHAASQPCFSILACLPCKADATSKDSDLLIKSATCTASLLPVTCWSLS